MDSFVNITFVIYTYNRPAYLKRTLTYFDSYGLPLKIIVADSSLREVKKYNEETVRSLKYLQVRLLNDFVVEVPPYQKCLEALKKVNTEFVVFSPDDDFLSLEGVNTALNFLVNNINYVAAEGKNIFFQHRNKKLRWSIGDVFSSRENDLATERFKEQAMNYQPTFYAVYHTNLLMHLFEEALLSGCIEYPFGEFQPSFSTVIKGKVKRLDIFYGARDHTDEFNRKVPPTNWIQKHKDDKTFDFNYKHYREVLIEELAKQADLSLEDAGKVVDKEMFYFFKQQETRFLIRMINKISPRWLYNILFYKIYIYVKWYKLAFRKNGVEMRKMQQLLNESKDWKRMKEFI